MAAVAAEVVVLGDYASGARYKGVKGAYAPLAREVPVWDYRMRGYDQTLAETVYWTSNYIDSGAADYTGPGPVVDIIISHVVGE